MNKLKPSSLKGIICQNNYEERILLFKTFTMFGLTEDAGYTQQCSALTLLIFNPVYFKLILCLIKFMYFTFISILIIYVLLI